MSDKLTTGVLAGSTDLSIPVELRKSSDATVETAVAFGSITAYYFRQGAASAAAITAAALTNLNDAHSDGGWKEVDATNLPGAYRLDIPDAMIATGADWVILTVKTTNSLFVERFDLTSRSLTAANGELSGAPAPTDDIVEMIKWMFARCRNQTDTTATTDTILKDDGTTTLSSATITDDGSTLTRGEYS